MDINDIKCFVISLENSKRPSNLENIRQVFKNAEKFSAVVGSDVDIYDSKLVNYITLNHIQHKRNFERVLTLSTGGLGCYLSHYELWRKCVKLNEPIVVCEDDLNFNHRVEVTKNIFNSIPSDAEFAAMYYIPILFGLSKLPNSRNEGWYSVDYNFAGTQCYYITPKCAELLIKTAFPMISPVDVYIAYIFENNTNMSTYASKNNPYTIMEFVKDDINSTISSKYNIKFMLPNGNMFYVWAIILFFIMFVVIVIFSYKLYKVKKLNEHIDLNMI